jgi:pimeloyl-ACP methyl ester carboxylesterase
MRWSLRLMGITMKHEVYSREATWNVLDVEVHGTITAPKGSKPLASVVFVAGSGPTDRDWCSPLLPGSNGSAKLLAEFLAEMGFATIRYDKMASGPHVMENFPKFAGKLSMQTHVDEVVGAVDALVSEVGAGKLFGLSNSEGTIHVINYQLWAKKDRFSGLVLTGAPGRSIGELGRSQVTAQLSKMPDADKLIAAFEASASDFAAGREVNPDPSLPDMAKMLLLGFSNPINLPFARELWNYDPAENLAKMDVPTLVLIGKKDIQVDWQVDGGLLQEAVQGRGSFEFVFPEFANHVLKHEAKERSQIDPQAATMGYNSPEAKLDQATVEIIYHWLKNRSKA